MLVRISVPARACVSASTCGRDLEKYQESRDVLSDSDELPPMDSGWSEASGAPHLQVMGSRSPGSQRLPASRLCLHHMHTCVSPRKSHPRLSPFGYWRPASGAEKQRNKTSKQK